LYFTEKEGRVRVAAVYISKLQIMGPYRNGAYRNFSFEFCINVLVWQVLLVLYNKSVLAMSFKPNTHRRRRRNSTVELSCVGGVY